MGCCGVVRGFEIVSFSTESHFLCYVCLVRRLCLIFFSIIVPQTSCPSNSKVVDPLFWKRHTSGLPFPMAFP